MVSILQSKKAGIPAVNEIVMTFLEITPKPILILLFILLITTLASFIIPSMLGLFGWQCVTAPSGDVELYQIPINIEFTLLELQRGLTNLLGAEPYALPSDPFPLGDKTRLRIPQECFIEQTINGTEVTGYVSACTDCPTTVGFFEGFYVPRSKLICTGDGYAVSHLYEEGLANQELCSQCRPPIPYYYNHTNCLTEGVCAFTITDESLEPDITTEYIDNVEYQRVREAGGIKRQQDSSQFANIQCDEDANASLYFFGIQVFNRTMWILLFVAYGLISFASMWYRMVGI